MIDTLFLQSDVQDPYAMYATMLEETPVYWDEINQHWAVYSYHDCRQILCDASAQIPGINEHNKDELNDYALLITGQLARLSNGAQHSIARDVTMAMFNRLKNISIDSIAGILLGNNTAQTETEWVRSIARRLPVIAVLKSLDFNDAATDFITNHIQTLVKLMAATKNSEQVTAINKISQQVYETTENYFLSADTHTGILASLQDKYKIERHRLVAACVSNLVGLFIQAYDAGRGLLSNALLQLLKPEIAAEKNPAFIKKLVIETLRFDPPVQHTRRIATADIAFKNCIIKKGQSMLVVTAAANRDSKKFCRPATFDIERINNNEHLTFGYGHHECVANYFSVYLATSTLSYFFDRYKNIRLLSKQIKYEPTVNVRLPKEILISIGN